MENRHDRTILRNLAERYKEVCFDEIQEERRDLWRRHNSLIETRPLIYMRLSGCDATWHEIPELINLECEDSFYRSHERFLRPMLYQDTVEDDFIFEPWITQRASFRKIGWGVKMDHLGSEELRGCWKVDPPLKKLEDISMLVPPHHMIDEEATARNVDRLNDVLGDLI